MGRRTSRLEVGAFRSFRIASGDRRNCPSLQIMADSPSHHFFDVPFKRVHHGILVVLISLRQLRSCIGNRSLGFWPSCWPLFSVTSTRKASGQGTSTPEERAQWVETTHKLGGSPLDDSVNKQGDAALKRSSGVHVIHVPLVPALLSEFSGNEVRYAHSITRHYMLTSGAFILEKSRGLSMPDNQ